MILCLSSVTTHNLVSLIPRVSQTFPRARLQVFPPWPPASSSRRSDYYVLVCTGRHVSCHVLLTLAWGVSVPHSCPRAKRDQFPPQRAFLPPYRLSGGGAVGRSGVKFIIAIPFNDLSLDSNI